jgi:hypothetical protein
MSEPAQAPELARPDPKRLSDLAASAVKEALVSNPHVWIYRVSILHGKEEPGFVAVSREYLFHAVYAKITADPGVKAMGDGPGWLENRLSVEIETVLNQHKARSGYATLAGAARPVWVLRLSQIKLEKGKAVRSEPVEVLECI